MTPIVRKAIAETIGTAILVFFAVGAAVFGIKAPAIGIGTVGVALAFGFVLLVLAYSIGPVSGCHVNPAVTLGVALSKGMTWVEAGYYWIAQFVGGIVGAALIQLVLSAGKATDTTGGKGTNAYDNGSITLAGAFVLEILLTFLLVFVVLLVTAEGFGNPGFAGLAIGLALVVIHLVGIPLDGTSVNPARSFGPALFAGGHALGQVWLFIVAPLIGGALAAFAAPLLKTVKSGGSSDPTGADVDRKPGGGSRPGARPVGPANRKRR